MQKHTQEQYLEFGNHVRVAHSLYKHLPVFGGARFYFFLSENSGGAFKFTEENPRLHYTWKTTREYRDRFGCLDYVWELNGVFDRDGNSSINDPDPKIPQFTKSIVQNSIQLTAFVGEDDDVIATQLERQLDYAPQEQKTWYEARVKACELLDQLTEEEMEIALQAHRISAAEKMPDAVADFLTAEEEAERLFRAIVHKEHQKVSKALERLKEMEARGEQVWFD